MRNGITTNIRRGAFIFILHLYNIQLHDLIALDNDYKYTSGRFPHGEWKRRQYRLPHLSVIAPSLCKVTSEVFGFAGFTRQLGMNSGVRTYGRSRKETTTRYVNNSILALIVGLRCRMRIFTKSNHEI